MSRLNMRRYQPQPGEVPEPLKKVAILGKPVFNAGLELCWQVYEARLQESKEVLSPLLLSISKDLTFPCEKSELKAITQLAIQGNQTSILMLCSLTPSLCSVYFFF